MMQFYTRVECNGSRANANGQVPWVHVDTHDNQNRDNKKTHNGDSSAQKVYKRD